VQPPGRCTPASAAVQPAAAAAAAAQQQQTHAKCPVSCQVAEARQPVRSQQQAAMPRSQSQAHQFAMQLKNNLQ
jgi:hypothetical protein